MFDPFGKNGASLWKLWKVLGYSPSTSSIYHLSLSSLKFVITFSSNLVKFLFHLNSFALNFGDAAHPYRLFGSK